MLTLHYIGVLYTHYVREKDISPRIDPERSTKNTFGVIINAPLRYALKSRT